MTGNENNNKEEMLKEKIKKMSDLKCYNTIMLSNPKWEKPSRKKEENKDDTKKENNED